MGVRAQGMPRTVSKDWLTFPFRNAAGIYDAFRHLKQFKPDLAVTTGGFVAFPVLAAARILGIPAVIHEQNAAMGVTNRIFAGSAAKVLLTYASAAQEDGKKTVLTGNPVRSAFLGKNVTSSRFNRKPGEFIILAVGGSRGALSLNRACIDLVKNWLPGQSSVRLIHISGERDHDMVKSAIGQLPENYTLLPYLHEMRKPLKLPICWFHAPGPRYWPKSPYAESRRSWFHFRLRPTTTRKRMPGFSKIWVPPDFFSTGS